MIREKGKNTKVKRLACIVTVETTDIPQHGHKRQMRVENPLEGERDLVTCHRAIGAYTLL